MLFTRNYIRKNLTLVSILIFVGIYSIVTYLKPGFLYNQDGSLRNFGLNSNKKTVIPIWLLAILLSLLSYLFVMYYLALPKLMY